MNKRTIVSVMATGILLLSLVLTGCGNSSANNDTLTALQTQVTALETKATSLQGQITSLQNQVGSTSVSQLASNLTTLQTSLTSLQTSLTSAQNDLATLRGRVDAINTATLQTQITTLSNQLTALDTRIKALETTKPGLSYIVSLTPLNVQITINSDTKTNMAFRITFQITISTKIAPATADYWTVMDSLLKSSSAPILLSLNFSTLLPPDYSLRYVSGDGWYLWTISFLTPSATVEVGQTVKTLYYSITGSGIQSYTVVVDMLPISTASSGGGW